MKLRRILSEFGFDFDSDTKMRTLVLYKYINNMINLCETTDEKVELGVALAQSDCYLDDYYKATLWNLLDFYKLNIDEFLAKSFNMDVEKLNSIIDDYSIKFLESNGVKNGLQ